MAYFHWYAPIFTSSCRLCCCLVIASIHSLNRNEIDPPRAGSTKAPLCFHASKRWFCHQYSTLPIISCLITLHAHTHTHMHIRLSHVTLSTTTTTVCRRAQDVIPVNEHTTNISPSSLSIVNALTHQLYSSSSC
jgi:hypothetical protein